MPATTLILCHIRSYRIGERFYSFPLFSTSLPFFSVVMKKHLALHYAVMWCLPISSEGKGHYQMWCVAHPVNLKLNLLAMISGLICQGRRVTVAVVPAGPIMSVAVLVLSSSTALSASCHHPKLARRPSAVEKSYHCRVFVFASSRNVSRGGSVNCSREWLNKWWQKQGLI